ncbi:hypothetical protein D3C80_2020670 [compost metagenome]
MQQALAAAIQAQVQFGQQRRASDNSLGLGLAHPCRGSRQVVGVEPGALDQAVQLATGEGTPPLC